ncbi:NAD(P)/FAD-dependent oxidoreductase [Pseudonocardia xishanensis]|uniref:NAD(P)/FAD-dependent oxidoreductase n=1 Tax=Pseudonocardia xishanensis TaxID=630995 RepID=A0ABP8RBY4_9PSEU
MDSPSPAGAAAERMTEEQVHEAVATANVPSLLMVLFQFSGDERWLAAPYLPTRGKGLVDHDSGGLPEDIQTEIREAAVPVILRLQAGERPAVTAPSPELTARMMSVCMGEPVDPVQGEMLAAEVARRIDPDQPELALPPVHAPEGFKILVIGAGVAGVAAAQQLEDMGLDYEILERQPDAGGVWWTNTYPGAGVDTPSHLYSFSFARNDWGRHFELRDDIQRYFAQTLKDLGADQRVRYNTEVLSATYDGERNKWDLRVRSGGVEETLTAEVVLTGVGSLNRPTMPNLPGFDTFNGTQFHSSEWPDDLELDGKRVVIVGTGASSMQISPAIAERVGHLTIVQRSPQWVAPFDKFLQPITPELRRLLQGCSLYFAWYWIRQFWQFGDKVIEALRMDPEWEHPERSVNARNDGHREFFTRYLTEKLEGRPDLIEKALPDYPPFGKRILLDNGWFATLKRDDVDLVTDSVAEVRPDGVVTASGTEIPADVIIWATGFQAARFLASVDVRGHEGAHLSEVWEDDNPKAYLGVSVPRFPNFFMLGGPNSFPGSGSFLYFMEVQMRYVRALLTAKFDHGIRALDARADVTEKYNELVDRTHERTVWSHPGMQTYYRNSRGRVIFVMPFLNSEYWQMTKTFDLSDYTVR